MQPMPPSDDLLLGPEGMTPQDVDDAWKRLLEETLPPEKQEALMETYLEEPDFRRRYNMLLEFSSYLRQGSAAASDTDAKAATRARVRANRPGYPGMHMDDDISLCWEISRVLLIVATVVGTVLGGAFWLSSTLEDAGVNVDDTASSVAAAAAAALMGEEKDDM